MSSVLPFLVVGVTVGSVYSLAGVGLVLTYKTSGIFNFGHGALATLSAYLFYTLHFTHHLAWPLAALISVGALGVVLGIGFERFARQLSQVSVAWQIASTIGVLLSVQALCAIFYSTDERTFPNFLPTSTFRVAGTNVGYNQLIIVAISLFATAALYIAFRVTRVGIATRAVVEAADLLAMAGTNPRLVRRWAWVVGCWFAALSGLLIAPSLPLDPFALTLLIVQAFGAAAIGNFASLPMTWVGGMIIGVVGSLATRYGGQHQIINGLSPGLPFIALFLVLLLYPKTRLRIRQRVMRVQPTSWRAPNRIQIALGVVFIALLALLPDLVGYRLDSFTLLLTSLLLFLSLGLLVRVAGQVSLCQLSFAAIGAVVCSQLSVEHHVPWPLALVIGGLATVPIGALLAIPAIRLSGLYLALATFGFGLLLQQMFYPSGLMFGITGLGVELRRPHLSWLTLDSERGFYYVVLCITIIVALGMVALNRSRLGRLLRGVADSPTMMVASGNGIMVPLVLVFCISAFVAGMAGALQGMVFGQVTGVNFDPVQSLVYLAVVMIALGSEPWYALVGAAGLNLLPIYITSSLIGFYLQLGFGAIAIAIALGGQPHSRLKAVIMARQWLDRVFGKPSVATELARSSTTGAALVGTTARASTDGGSLSVEVRDLTVRFSGLVAVQNLTLTARPGLLTGLIGPNGAGKTTVLNACSGFVSPTNGQIRLNDVNVSRKSPARRARMGLGRSFQQMELCDSLSVWDNVAIGSEGALAGARISRQIFGRRSDARTIRTSTEWALTRCGLAGIADVQVGELSSAERRFVELARCLAGPFKAFLLDEPSSGLDTGATQRLGRLLRDLVEQDGVTILLVEHDMSLVMSVCDDIYVMDFGKLLMHGSPREVQASEAVRLSYLGVGSPLLADELDAQEELAT